MLRLHLYRNGSEAGGEGWELKPGKLEKDNLLEVGFLRQFLKGLGCLGSHECYQWAEDRRPALPHLHLQNAFGMLVFPGATYSRAFSQGTWHHSLAH